MSAENARLEWVDIAKGLSIILVVMMHSAYGVGAETGDSGVLHWIIGWATPFRMPEFFLISGLFLGSVIARDWARYADRRVIHYLYFYALWAVLQIVFKVGLGTGDPLAAASQMAWAIVEPYGVLWFIYMLAAFSLATKVLWELRAPHWMALGIGVVLQVLPVQSGSYLVDQFAAYFVYFYAGYAFAPRIFRIVEWAQDYVPLAISGLVSWALLNTALVFSLGFEMTPDHVRMGLAGLPVIHLVLALAGSVALCVISGLLSRLPLTGWLRWLGEHSIVVYLSFSIPMAASRLILLKLAPTDDTSLISIAVMLTALVAPLVLFWLIGATGFGRFLFARPAWAHLPGTPGSRGYEARAFLKPAE